MAKTLAQMRTAARLIIRETDTSNSHFTESELTGFSNEAYRKIATALRVLPKKERDYAVASRTITLNSATINIQEAILKDPGNSNKFKRLEIISLEQLIEMDPDYQNATTEVPGYFIRSNTAAAQLYPPPKASVIALTTPLKTFGLELPTALSADGDTPSLPENTHDIFENWMAFRCFESLGDGEKAGQQLVLFRGALKEMKEISTSFSHQTRGWRWD